MSDTTQQRFTAGPYYVERRGEFLAITGGNPADRVQPVVARMAGRADQPETLANASLLRAAPDLLSALQRLARPGGILDTAESNASGMANWDAVSADVNAARAAIARALTPEPRDVR